MKYEKAFVSNLEVLQLVCIKRVFIANLVWWLSASGQIIQMVKYRVRVTRKVFVYEDAVFNCYPGLELRKNFCFVKN